MLEPTNYETDYSSNGICVLDCIRFAKIRNDSGDPSDSRSDSTMKKNTASTTYLGQEYTPHFFECETRVVLAEFFHSRVTPRVTRITGVVANLCEYTHIYD